MSLKLVSEIYVIVNCTIIKNLLLLFYTVLRTYWYLLIDRMIKISVYSTTSLNPKT